MKTRFAHLLLLAVTALSVSAQDTSRLLPTEDPFDLNGTANRGVYGSDNRIEVTEATGYEVFGKATLVMLDADDIHDDYIDAESLRAYLKWEGRMDIVSPNIRFLDQPTCGYCTGFLIAPDLLVTAGHCISDTDDLQDYVWMLDYTSEMSFDKKSERLAYKPEQIVRATELLCTSVDSGGDYAVVRLDRPLDREAYRFRVSGKVAQGQEIYMIGSPTGLPLKFVDDARVKDNSNEDYFEANLDAFSGNSGGPVFDTRGWIEGILVRGAEDYEVNVITRILSVAEEDQYSYYYNEDVQRISAIPQEILVEAIYNNIAYAIESNDMALLEKWMIYTGIAEHPFVIDRGGLEALAMQEDNVEALEMIVASSAKYKEGMQHGVSLMKFAIEQDHIAYLAELLDDGYNPNATDSSGQTPVVWAMMAKNSEAVDLLLKRGGSINVQFGKEHDSFLHMAVREHDEELMDKVLSLGIDPELENRSGNTACELANLHGKKEMKKKLKRAEKQYKNNKR